MLENIQGILFDLDDTIIDFESCENQALQYLFSNIVEIYRNEYQKVFRTIDADLWSNRNISKEIIPEYRFEKLFNLLKIEYKDYKSANELFMYGLENSKGLIDGAKEILEYLYSKKYKLFIITNGLLKLQKARILKNNIEHYFLDVIVSEEAGVPKPNPILFNQLLQRNNLNPNNVIMIGDSLEQDIKGAQNASIKSIWYNPNKAKNNTSIVPNYEISSLLELKNILNGGIMKVLSLTEPCATLIKEKRN